MFCFIKSRWIHTSLLAFKAKHPSFITLDNWLYLKANLPKQHPRSRIERDFGRSPSRWPCLLRSVQHRSSSRLRARCLSIAREATDIHNLYINVRLKKDKPVGSWKATTRSAQEQWSQPRRRREWQACNSFRLVKVRTLISSRAKVSPKNDHVLSNTWPAILYA